MSPERVRAVTTAVTIMLALLAAMALLVIALIAIVATGPVRPQTWTLPTLGLLLAAIVAVAAAAIFARRRVRLVEIRTSPEGIEYEAATLLIRSTWENCERIGVVPIGIGYGEGIVLREPGLVRARFPDMQRAQRLDRVIPLTNVMWWWRDTEMAADLARWAPQLGVRPTVRGTS